MTLSLGDTFTHMQIPASLQFYLVKEGNPLKFGSVIFYFLLIICPWVLLRKKKTRAAVKEKPNV